MKKLILILLALVSFNTFSQTTGDCHPSTAIEYLDINNVRTPIMGGGDMWWDLAKGGYEIPKGSGAISLFAGGLWVGGVDEGGQLRVAAQTYRQGGNDYWPGPLDTTTGSTLEKTCWKYDKIYKINKWLVEEFITHRLDPGYVIPDEILNWPAHGDPANNEPRYLAPFRDVNADGIYNPYDGDFPDYGYSASTQSCEGSLLGDQTLWWVFNDMGNAHTKTGGQPLGIEVHAQAFAYNTNDELNNMTFYQYKIINRSQKIINETYVGQWVDADLGYPFDDYVGCDVARGLGYCYNGNDMDGMGAPGQYGSTPPAVGVDFIGGPKADLNDGVDNDRDGTIDEPGERIAMSKFVFYQSDFTITGNPSRAEDHYNFLRGRWKDGKRMTYGGHGYQTGGVECDFMFPGSSDPTGFGTGGVPQAPWDETTAGNIPGDRRFLMSAGPFTMKPGDVQYVTIGVVWARSTSGGAQGSVQELFAADDKMQTLFDDCFDLPCTPPIAKIDADVDELKIKYAFYGNADNYTWDFGDGNSSNKKYGEHAYQQDGTYQLCLTVKNACGQDITCDSVTVEKYVEPLGFKLRRIEGTGNGGNMLELAEGMHDSILASPAHEVIHPLYAYNQGPVNVTVTDSGLVPKGMMAIKFTDVSDSAKWKMYLIGSTDTVYANKGIDIAYEQKITQWGLKVSNVPAENPGSSAAFQNGFLMADKKDNANSWLTAIQDNDALGSVPTKPDNWIRSGTLTISPWGDYVGIDDAGDFENILGATWAPYRLCAYKDAKDIIEGGPAWEKFITLNKMENLSSVDVVITPDKNKWSRCPVFELSDDPVLSEGQARKLDKRKAPSVDKNGNPDGTGTGMGWFPGYAINIETGERLNMAFGEDSRLPLENGRDMIWNPTSTKFHLPDDAPYFGGKHYIYIFGHSQDDLYSVGSYDEAKKLDSIIDDSNGAPTDLKKRNVFRQVMWVNLPLLNSGHQLLEDDVTIKLRVTKKYAKGYSTITDQAVSPINDNNPLYYFDTNNMLTDLHEQADKAIIKVTVLPNPFENDARIKIESTIRQTYDLSIFDISGRRVKSFQHVNEFIQLQKGDLARGIYIYAVSKNNQQLATGKLVVK